MKTTIVTALMMLLMGSVSYAFEDSKTMDTGNYELTTPQVDPFFMAVIKGDLDTVAKMIEEGANVNLRLDGKTPLMYAARYNRVDIIRLLIGKGASLNAKDKSGNTAMKLAELANASEAMGVLKEYS